MTVAAYRDRSTGRYPITLDDLRRSAGVLFGEEPGQDVLDLAGVDPVTATPAPAYDPAKQTLAEGAPAQAGGAWRQAWVVTALPPPGAAAVDAERDRRIAAGITFEGVRYQTDDVSRGRADRSRGSALAAIVGGAQRGDLRWHGQPIDFFWIATDNSHTKMDAQTMAAFGSAIVAIEGMHIAAGDAIKRRLKAGETITDITDASLWPA